MKNLHLLPTDKPSRLFYDVAIDKLVLTDTLEKSKWFQNFHIYITNDDTIIQRDWCYDKVLNIIFQTDEHTDFTYINITNNVLKIILTDNKELIADGVQGIDDEFLEWFCSKNGKVDFVKVIIIEDEKN